MEDKKSKQKWSMLAIEKKQGSHEESENTNSLSPPVRKSKRANAGNWSNFGKAKKTKTAVSKSKLD